MARKTQCIHVIAATGQRCKKAAQKSQRVCHLHTGLPNTSLIDIPDIDITETIEASTASPIAIPDYETDSSEGWYEDDYQTEQLEDIESYKTSIDTGGWAPAAAPAAEAAPAPAAAPAQLYKPADIQDDDYYYDDDYYDDDYYYYDEDWRAPSRYQPVSKAEQTERLKTARERFRELAVKEQKLINAANREYVANLKAELATLDPKVEQYRFLGIGAYGGYDWAAPPASIYSIENSKLFDY